MRISHRRLWVFFWVFKTNPRPEQQWRSSAGAYTEAGLEEQWETKAESTEQSRQERREVSMFSRVLLFFSLTIGSMVFYKRVLSMPTSCFMGHSWETEETKQTQRSYPITGTNKTLSSLLICLLPFCSLQYSSFLQHSIFSRHNERQTSLDWLTPS